MHGSFLWSKHYVGPAPYLNLYVTYEDMSDDRPWDWGGSDWSWVGITAWMRHTYWGA